MALRAVYIYALCDPDTEDVRYIGKSVNPHARFLKHLSPCDLRANTYKNAWLRSLLAEGRRPTLTILATADSQTWQGVEREYIAAYRALGARLTNGTDGGEGPPIGRKMSAEAVRKSAAARRGKPRVLTPAALAVLRRMHERAHTPEAKAKRADALRGRKRPPEVMEKCASAKRGHPLSAEHRQKLVVSHQGKPHPHSEAARRNMARAQHGKALPSHNTSGYKGVSWHKGVGRWYAYITLEGKRRHLGVYATAEQAARAYNEAARGLFGADARLNEIDE